MNTIVNDRGEVVTSVGAPGSFANIVCRYPALIAQLNKLYDVEYDSYGRGVDRAIKLIRSAGIEDEQVTCDLLLASSYGSERPESVTNFVVSFSKGHGRTHDN